MILWRCERVVLFLRCVFLVGTDLCGNCLIHLLLLRESGKNISGWSLMFTFPHRFMRIYFAWSEDQYLLLSFVNSAIQADLYSFSGCNIASHSLFKDILQRKDEADAKRNVLSVLHRFRFLFSLPRSIEKNIQQVLTLLTESLRKSFTLGNFHKSSMSNIKFT